MLELKACATIPGVKAVIRHICVKGWGGETERERENIKRGSGGKNVPLTQVRIFGPNSR